MRDVSSIQHEKNCAVQLTTLWKKLRINHFERFFFDDARRTLRLEAAIYPFDFGLRESGRLAEGL
jgi:hypothetical protein